ncbi:MAG: hypothetical protein O2968_21270 [Acidobacteria bacterium]|nr:hypothetical protein [Acidobacteriota bacterium]
MIRPSVLGLLLLLAIPLLSPSEGDASAAERRAQFVLGTSSQPDNLVAPSLAKSGSGSDNNDDGGGNSGSGSGSGGGDDNSGSGNSGSGNSGNDDGNSGSGSGNDNSDDSGDDSGGSGNGGDDSGGGSGNSGSGSGGDDGVNGGNSGSGSGGGGGQQSDRIRREGRDREVIGGLQAELNARWEQRDDRTTFRVEVRNLLLDPPRTLTVCARSGATGAILVEGSLGLNAFGAGEFKIDSRNGVNVPTIEPGDQADVRLGSCASNTTSILSARIGGGGTSGVTTGTTTGNSGGGTTSAGGRIRREGRDRRIVSGARVELNARWEQRDDRTIFRAEVRNLPIDTSGPLNVCVLDATGGGLILSGQLSLNTFGSGEFKLDSRNGNEVPTVQSGDVVNVQQGSCSSSDTPILSAVIGGGISAIPREGSRIEREGRDRRIIDGAQVELNARWEQRDDRTTFRVEVERFVAAQGTTLNMCLISGSSGVVALEGRISLNTFGTGEFKIDSQNGDTVPVVEPGDVVVVHTGACSSGETPLLSATIGGAALSNATPLAACALPSVEALGSDDSKFLVVASGSDAEDGSLDPSIELFASDSDNNEALVALLEVGDKIRLRSGRDQIQIERAGGEQLVDNELEVHASASRFRVVCTVEDSQGMTGVDDVVVASGLSTDVRLSRNGIVNAATFGPAGTLDEAIAPGSIISLFGEFGAAVSQARQIPLPTELNDLSVTVNGVAAPLFFVSSGQINAQLPWSALQAGQTSGLVSVQVTSNGVSGSPRTVRVRDFAPGIFTFTYGGGPAVAMNLDGTLAQPHGSVPGVPSHPARAGEVLVILATGLGHASSSIQSGEAAGDTIIRTGTTPEVLIGGRKAQVVFSGLSPQFVGVNQLNVIAPEVEAGQHVSLQLRLGSMITSDDVTIAIE